MNHSVRSAVPFGFVGIFHRATITPTKQEVITQWVPTQSWGPAAGEELEIIGSYRFDDPDGRVGMESFLVRASGVLFHVPLTYRDEPLSGDAHTLVTTMQHSVLGERWVYDGLSDPVYLTMLAGAAMTGQGEALGMVVNDGRLCIAPSKVRIHGGGWTQERVPVDGFQPVAEAKGHDGATPVFSNGRFELQVWHRPSGSGEDTNMGLTASWAEQPQRVLLAQVSEG